METVKEEKNMENENIIQIVINKEKGTKYEIIKQPNELYGYKYLEYSKMCNCWIYITREENYTKDAMEKLLNINIEF